MDIQENSTPSKSASWKMFNQISGRYDLLNRLLSLGQDVRWRKALLPYLPARPGLNVLDLATGTADVAITLVEGSPNIHALHGVDMAQEMLNIGQRKIAQKGLDHKIMLQQGDAQALTFLDGSFDVVTISFGIRNLPDLRQGLLEMRRVLKPGGRVLILEFSIPQNIILKLGHWVYMHVLVPVVGFVFSGNFKAYRYLNQTVATFPYGEQFCRIIKQFGFKNIQAHPLMGGVATIYVGDK